MGRVRKVNGDQVMSEEEFAGWQDQCDFQMLRRHLAKRLLVTNFRRLALVCGDQMLVPESRWVDAELVVVVRPYVPNESTDELLRAAGKGETAQIVELLERPLDPEACLGDRMALADAAGSGHRGVVHCLLEAGVDKNRPDDDGLTPLHRAARSGFRSVVHCLLEAGADKDTPDNYGVTPMHCAAKFGQPEVVRCLLEAGADKDKPDSAGWTPLHSAARFGHRGVVSCLLEAGAAKDKQTDAGWTPMHCAARAGFQKVVDCLLEAGADKDKLDNGGRTALYCAARSEAINEGNLRKLRRIE